MLHELGKKMKEEQEVTLIFYMDRSPWLLLIYTRPSKSESVIGWDKPKSALELW